MKKIDSAVIAAHQWVVDSTGISPSVLATACWYAAVAVGALMVMGVSKFGLWSDPIFVLIAVNAFVLTPLALFLAQRIPPAQHHLTIAVAIRLYALSSLAIDFICWVLDSDSQGFPVIMLNLMAIVLHLYFCACEPPRPRKRTSPRAAFGAAP